jgi:hypothetical protein
MFQRHELIKFEQEEIIGLWKGGYSKQNIEEILGHPKSNIHGTITIYKNSGIRINYSFFTFRKATKTHSKRC